MTFNGKKLLKMASETQKMCYICNVPFSPGAHRRIGVCVNCIVDQKELEQVVRIPGPRYSREIGDGEPS